MLLCASDGRAALPSVGNFCFRCFLGRLIDQSVGRSVGRSVDRAGGRAGDRAVGRAGKSSVDQVLPR